MKTFRTGETAPVSGQYGLVGPRGGKTNKEITMIKGQRFPPTPAHRQSYCLVDRTRNKSGRGG